MLKLPLMTKFGFLKRLGFKIDLGEEDFMPYTILTRKHVSVGCDLLNWFGFVGPFNRRRDEFLRLSLFTPTVSVTLDTTSMTIDTASLAAFIFILPHATADWLWSHLSFVEMAIIKYQEYRIAYVNSQEVVLMGLLADMQSR